MPVNKDKPFGDRRCNSCSNMIRGLQKRKVWQSFVKKPEDQKVAAYKDRKGKKYQQLDVMEMEVSIEENDTQYKSHQAADRYLPFPKWKAQRMAEDFTRTAWDDRQWQEEWNRVLDAPETDKMFKRGLWHVGEYFGVEVLDGHSKQMQTSLKRKRGVDSADQLQELMEEAKGMAQKWARQSSAIIPQVQTHTPEPYAPREGEIDMKIQETRFVAGQQHDISKEASQVEKDYALSQPEPKVKPAKPPRSKMVLKLEWEAEVARAGTSLLSAVVQRQEKMQVAFLEQAEDDLAEAEMNEIDSMNTTFKHDFSVLKAKSEATKQKWDEMETPEDAESYAAKAKVIQDDKSSFIVNKLY